MSAPRRSGGPVTDTPAPYLAVAFLSALFLLVAGLQAEGLLW
ncbi:hypothetical protein ACU4GA_25040 [Methylobacterium oryzae CBMB20]